MNMSSRASVQRPRALATPSVEGTRVIAESESRLRSALRVVRSNTTRQQCRSVADLARDFIQKRRYSGIRHLATIARDAFERGAPIEDVKAFSREYDSLVESWYAERDASSFPSLAAVHCAEEHAEAVKEVAETAFAYSPGPREAAVLLSSIERHNHADSFLARFARGVLSGARA